MVNSILNDPDYGSLYPNNLDSHNQELGFDKMFDDVMLKSRRNEMDLYKLWPKIQL